MIPVQSTRTLCSLTGLLLCAFIAMAAGPSGATAAVLDVADGETVQIRGVHIYDSVNIAGHLILIGDTTLNVRGDMRVQPLGYIYSDGDGTAGADGESTTEPGARGENGRSGTSGRAANDLTLFITGDLYLKGRITANGGLGGDGGAGGNGGEGTTAVCTEPESGATSGGGGGNGGSGGFGGKAGVLTIVCRGTIYHSDSGSLQANGGLGGSAGMPGLGRRGGDGCMEPVCDPVTLERIAVIVNSPAPGGRPGKAGTPGNGGDGGKILVWAKYIESTTDFVKSLALATGGMGGHGADAVAGTSGIVGSVMRDDLGYHCYTNVPGVKTFQASPGGTGGTGGEIYFGTCEINRINDMQVGGGYGGNAGNSKHAGDHIVEPRSEETAEFCAAWRQGMPGFDGPVGGVGAPAGSIRVETFTVGPYNLSALGGDGGDGGDAGQSGLTNCAWVNYGSICNSTNGAASDGGGGGTGGLGGDIRLKYSSFVDISGFYTTVTYSGGTGGPGGEAGKRYRACPDCEDEYGNAGAEGTGGDEGAFRKIRIVDPTLYAKLASNTNLVQTGKVFSYVGGVTSPRLRQCNLQVTMDLPDQCEIVRVTSFPSAAWSSQDGKITWDIPRILACQSYTFKVDLRVRQDAGPVKMINQLVATTDQISKPATSERVIVNIFAPAGE